MHWLYRHPLPSDKHFPTRIEIIHGSQSFHIILTWVALFSVHFILRYHSGAITFYENNVTHVETG